MEVFHGKLLRNGKVVVDSLDGKLTIRQGPRGEELWSGFCSLPGDVRLGLTDVLDLVLDDDRVSKIRIDRVNAFGPTLTVSFLSWSEASNGKALARR